MKLPLLSITLIGFILAAQSARADNNSTATATATASTTSENTAGSPILCGVSPKGKDLISTSAALSEAEESLDLLLEALSSKQSRKLEKIINQGSLEELVEIDGIAEGRAKTIVAGRPYREVKELMLIKGFGYSIVASVIMHGSNLEP